MTPMELIERLRQENPRALGRVDDRTAGRLLRSAFAAVAKDIESAPDGAVRVGGLGVFRVRNVTAKADGKGARRLVLFKAVAPKTAAA